MDAAIDVFWRKGYAGTSMQELADEVGVLKGSLYHYISSKEDLLFRIFEGSHREASQIMDAVAQLDAPPLERLGEYINRFVVFYVTHVERVGLYLREWRFLPPVRGESLKEHRRAYDRFVIDLIREAQDAGEVSPDVDPRTAAFFILGAVNSISDWYRPDGPEPPEAIARRYADLALAALR